MDTRSNQSSGGSPSKDLARNYQLETGRHPLLSKDDEVRLARHIEDGRKARLELDTSGDAVTRARRRDLEASVETGENARRTFIQADLRLVLSVAAGVDLSSTRVRQLHGAAVGELRHRLEGFAG
jgi:RNA polymerase primary sigma factor